MNFNELIITNNLKINIPKIQRDYAQGRAKFNKNGKEITSEKAYQVRLGLVDTLFDSITNNKLVDLNFVYGKKDSSRNEFIPIDGQQRLTTLFLLHWYIYQRANLEDDIMALGEKFTYDTRDTTKEFCSDICRELLPEFKTDGNDRIKNLAESSDDNRKEYSLSTVLLDKKWFTSGYLNDPSIKSMLNMLDTIEYKFVSSGEYDSIANFVVAANTLKSSDCPITFTHTAVDDFDDEDMYIKMNARGKELTNFEIFKANLEEGDILDGVCYDTSIDTPEQISKKIADFVGKYNNEYINLFYGMDEIGKDKYDNAIFRFVECFIKLDHLAHITTNTKVGEKKYNRAISNTNYTGMMLFNDYVSNPTLHGYTGDNATNYITELKSKSKQSLKKITEILEFVCTNDFSVFPKYKENLSYKNGANVNNTTYNERELLVSNSEESSSIIHVTQYALLSFLSVTDCNNTFNKEAYLEWKRFVCNITYKFAIKDPVNFAKMAGVFDVLLSFVKEKYVNNGNTISGDDILEIIKLFDNNDILRPKQDANDDGGMSMDVIRPLFNNEKFKANLMLTSQAWKDSIVAAEAYYKDGDIKFLFDAIADNLTPANFDEVFEKSKKWIDEDKNPISESLLNETLLCMDYDDEHKKYCHMKNYSREEVWQLYYDSEKQKNLREALADDQNIARSAIIQMLRDYSLSQEPVDYKNKLFANYAPLNKCWLRNVLVEENIIEQMEKYRDDWGFSGTFGIWGPADENEYVLFYSTAYNSVNLEFNTYRLALKLIPTHPEVSLHYCKGKIRNLVERYVVVNDKKVSYDMEQHLFYNLDTKSYFTANNDDLGMEAAFNYLN